MLPWRIRLPIGEWYCWWFRIPAPVEVGMLSHYLQGFIHPRWLFGISSINSSWLVWPWPPTASNRVVITIQTQAFSIAAMVGIHVSVVALVALWSAWISETRIVLLKNRRKLRRCLECQVHLFFLIMIFLVMCSVVHPFSPVFYVFTVMCAWFVARPDTADLKDRVPAATDLVMNAIVLSHTEILYIYTLEAETLPNEAWFSSLSSMSWYFDVLRWLTWSVKSNSSLVNHVEMLGQKIHSLEMFANFSPQLFDFQLDK